MMFFSAADNRNPQSLASRLRRKRTELFGQLLLPFSEPVRVLDIGGTPSFWRHNAQSLPRQCHFTLLNLGPVSVQGLDNARCVVGDARNTGFADRQYDVVFSNSVIEHVGTLSDQVAMAREVRRVGHAYFVQTPNRYFPLEPHFLVPLWQFLPVTVRTALHRRFRLGWMERQSDALRARAAVEQIRLLRAGEMRGLFPDAQIIPERVGGLVKSFIAVRTGSSDRSITEPTNP